MLKKHNKQGNEFHAETLALGYGYDPIRSEGAVKPPVFLTSTFQFESAEEGKRFFELAYGLKKAKPGEDPGLIYSRLNNPNIQIFEERLAAWDKTEKGATFASGMAAISTSLLALLKPGEHIISSSPLYGGTYFFFEKILPVFGIHVTQVPGGNHTPELMLRAAKKIGIDKVRMFYIETPGNPSNILVDISAIARIARKLNKGKKRPILTAVDNTFLGPVFQKPATLGADLVIYSATKFIGGHSDLIAGVITGPADLLKTITEYRTILGTMAMPFAGWMLLRSLETLSIRMRQQAKNAQRLSELLAEHPKISKVSFPGLLKEGDPQKEIYDRQCTGPGSLIAFEVKGGQKAAFKVLNSFEVCRLAVSLGGTESLVEHPMTMTHSDVPKEEHKIYGINPSQIRMSVGIEHVTDLERDLISALSKI